MTARTRPAPSRLSRVSPLLAAATALLVAACSGGAPADEEPFPQGAEDVTVRIVNTSGVRVSVEVSWAGTPAVFVGTVQSGEEGTFTTAYETGYAQFVIDYAASATARSSRITPRPGDELLLTIRSRFDITVDRVNPR